MKDIGRSYATEVLKAAIAQSTLDKAQIKTILSANGLQGALLETTVDGLANAASTNVVAASQVGTTVTTLGLSTAFKGLIISIKSAIVAMGTFLLTNPVGWCIIAGGAIFGLTKLIDGLITTDEELNQEIKEIESNWKELASTIQNSAKSFQDLKKQADDIIPKYIKLAQGVDKYGNNISLTEEEFKDFVSLNNQLGEMFPELVSGYDLNGNAILALSDNIDILTESLYACVEAQRLSAAQEIADTMPEIVEGDNGIIASVDLYEEQMGRKQDALDEWNKFVEHSRDSLYKDGTKQEDRFLKEDVISYAEDLGVRREQIEDLIEWIEDEGGGHWNYDKVFDSTVIKNAIAGYEKEIENILNKIEAKWKQLNPVVSAWLSTDFLYQDLDTNTQNVVTKIIGELDFKDLGLKTSEKVQDYISDNIISPIYNMDSEVQEALFELFNLQEAGDIPVEEYQDKIQKLLESIKELPYEDKKNIMSWFGVYLKEDGTFSSDIDNQINIVKKQLQDQFDSKVEGLTLKELQIATDLTIKNNPNISFNGIDYSKGLIETQLKSLEEGGSVNLTLRPIIDTSLLNDAGWDAGKGTATVFSSTFSNEDETVAINFTPIIADPETGEYLGVLSPDELQAYAKGVINGTHEDYLNLQIGSEFKGEDAIEQATESALKIHDLHEKYFVDDDTLLSWDELNVKIKEFKESNESNKTPILSFTKVISQVQSLSKGLDQLDKIYADVWDKEDFDWSSILNNKDFEEAFGGLPEYDSFIKTISNNKDDIDACQGSFNRLATAYINSSDAMKNLSDETKDATIEFLKQMGVENAKEFVEARLAAQEEFLTEKKRNSAITSADLESATWDEITAIALEGDVSEKTKLYLANLALAKFNLSDNPINTDADVDAIIAIANAAGVSEEYINRLEKAKQDLADAENKHVPGSSGGDAFLQHYRDEAAKTVEEVQNEFAKIDPSDFYADIRDGSNTKNTRDNTTKDAEKEFKETYNWIETAITRIERLISRLKSKAESVYKTWTSRNQNLRKEISAVRNEIGLQQSAYDKYMQQANSVGLSADWAARVQNGNVDIETVTDEGLSEKIKEYQEWYEKAIACQDAIDSLNETISDLYKTHFDNITAQYDNLLGDIESRKNQLDASISHTEEKGWLVGAEYYKKLMDVERENIAQMENKRNSLLNAISNAVTNGSIEKYSQAWYDMRKQIDELALSIAQANTEMVKYGNSIREIQWQVFDLVQERMSDITSEAEFLINLLDNSKLYNEDNGQLTDEGLSVMGLHGVNYNVYMAQADKYAKEMLDIDRQLAKDPNNQELAKRRKELLELQQEMIIAAEGEKEAIKDMVKEGINLELDALRKLIDAYTDALDSQKDLYDYQKNIAKQTKEIASLEKQLSAYEGDLSEETRQKVQQIRVSLEEARANLEETEYDKYISDQKQLLDDLYNEYELALNLRLDNVDALIADMIDKINLGSSTINTTIQEQVEAVGYTLSDSMANIWEINTGSITDVLTTYGENLQNGILSAATTVNETLNGINANVQSMISQLDVLANMKTQSVTTKAAVPSAAIGSKGSSASPSSNASNKSAGTGPWGSWFKHRLYSGDKSALNINTSIVDRLKYHDIDFDFNQREKYYYAMGGTDTYTGTADQNKFMLDEMKAHGFSKGGFVAGLQKVAYHNGDELVTLNTLKPGEMIFTPEQAAKFSRLVTNLDKANFATDLSSALLGMSHSPSTSKTESTVNNNIDLEITLPNVNNYNEFMDAMLHDKKAKRALQELTLGELAGHGSLQKYNVRFQ